MRHRIHAIILLLIAATLAGFGLTGILATHAAFVDCEPSQVSDACLEAMDGAPHFYALLSTLWLIAVAVAVVAAVLAPARGPRALALSALGLILLMNTVTEYALWLGIYGGHWDVPPGTGYTQSAAFVLAGVLVAMAASAALERARASRRDDTATTPADATPPLSSERVWSTG